MPNSGLQNVYCHSGHQRYSIVGILFRQSVQLVTLEILFANKLINNCSLSSFNIWEHGHSSTQIHTDFILIHSYRIAMLCLFNTVSRPRQMEA